MDEQKGDFLFGFDASSFTRSIKAMKAGISDLKTSISDRMNQAAQNVDRSFASMAKSKAFRSLRDAYSYAKTDIGYRASVLRFYGKKMIGGGAGAPGADPDSTDKIAAAMDGLTGKIVKALAVFEALKIAVRDTFNFLKEGAMSAIPEIGQTFSIAKNIFFKNLLWPLRKELLPILQRVLDWTRQHRADFVLWGSTIVSVFKAAKNVAVAFFSALSPLFSGLFSSLRGIFGDTTRSIVETVNLAIFKVAALTEIAVLKLRPVAEKIGQVFSWVGRMATTFFKSMFDGLRGADFSVLTASLRELGDALNTIRIGGEGIASVFGKAFARMIITAVAVLTDLGYTIGALIATIHGDPDKAEAITKKMWDANRRLAEAYNETGFGSGANSAASSGSPSGLVQPTSRRYAEATLNIGDIHLHVTEGDARRAGENFADGILGRARSEDARIREMRRGLMNERMREGGN